MRIRFWNRTERSFSIRPFVYATDLERDPDTLQRIYVPDTTRPMPIRFFVRGDSYKFWGLFTARLHLFGVEGEDRAYLLGTDFQGRDLLTRIVYGTRISLTIGFVGVALSFTLGIVLGAISGYFGGAPDMIIQRIIEVLMAIPGLPLWMALSAAIPLNWPITRVFFFITVILSLRGWTGMARVVRGKLLSLRGEEFVIAARIDGAGGARIMFRHLIPSFLSHIIASATLSIPAMILGETALSFLGIGLRPPAISWGVLLQGAQNVQAVAIMPWLLLPGVFVVIIVLAFNFFGDGLRDAADPYA
jgi:peptide/nickel transport system permease protein